MTPNFAPRTQHELRGKNDVYFCHQHINEILQLQKAQGWREDRRHRDGWRKGETEEKVSRNIWLSLKLNVGVYRWKRIASLTSTDPDILELSKPDYHNPHPPPIMPYVQPQAYDNLHDLRVFIALWSKEYGPITCWPHTLQELHEDAMENDKEQEWHRDLNDNSVGL